MITHSKLQKEFPIIHTNTKWQKIYNPNYEQYFHNHNPQNYLDLAQKLAQEHSQIFRHIYLEEEKWRYKDILENGNLSCAVFVSQVLFYFKLINTPNANVSSLEKNLLHHGRKKVDFNEHKDMLSKIPLWSILVRANQKRNLLSSSNPKDFFISDYHIWFYNGNGKAISNVVYQNWNQQKAIAQHDAIRNAPKHDHYDKIEIIRYYHL